MQVRRCLFLFLKKYNLWVTIYSVVFRRIAYVSKAEVATCQWHVFSNDRSEAETGKEFRNGFDADLFINCYC